MSVRGRLAGRALVALALGGPALALIPWQSGVITALAGSALLVAAMHGWGRVVARLAGSEVDPALAIGWGLAALIAASSAITAAGMGGELGHRAIILSGAAANAVLLARRARTCADAVAAALTGPGVRAAVVPIVLAVALGGLALLAAAGDPIGDRPFDDDGHLLGRLRELGDTGALDDHIGYARVHQLGGQAALGALATLGLPHGSLALARLLDGGLAFGLLLALALTRLRPVNVERALWSGLVVIALSALAVTTQPATPGWTISLLVLVLALTLDAHRTTDASVALGLAVGALATLRDELVPLALVGVLGAWWLRRRLVRADAARIATLIGAVALAVLPLLASRIATWATTPGALAMLAPPLGSLPTRLLLFAISLSIVAALLALITAPPRRWVVVAIAASIAGIVSQLAGERAFAMRFVPPLVIPVAVLLVIDLAAEARLHTAGLVTALLACVVIHQGRDASGRRRWNARLAAQTQAIEHLRHGILDVSAAAATSYTAALTRVPTGATIAAWVGQPEALDRSRHRVLDLRTPRGARLRAPAAPTHRATTAGVLSAAGARYLLLEDVSRARHGAPDKGAASCTAPPEACADEIEGLAWRYPTDLIAPGLRLVELPQSSPSP